MKIEVAIIGGTGIGDRLAQLGGSALHVPTPEGLLRGRVLELAGKGVLLISRHSVGHKTPPHRVNYKAMALGLEKLGVAACFASAAVGSLRPEWGAGTFVACSDFLDFTGRNLTIHDRSVRHIDFTAPFGSTARQALIRGAARLSIPIEKEGIYLCGNGPRYETPHEIEVYGKLGDVVGMTAASEAIVMREAGVDYGCLAVVTNFAAGISEDELAHEEVVREMHRAGDKAVRLFQAAIEELG